jgi:hypothetical protein
VPLADRSPHSPLVGGVLVGAHSGPKTSRDEGSYERIAEAAGCARSTVAEALKGAGVLSWVQRIERIREACPDLLGDEGWRWQALRTSNSYAFTDPSPAAESPFENGCS